MRRILEQLQIVEKDGMNSNSCPDRKKEKEKEIVIEYINFFFNPIPISCLDQNFDTNSPTVASVWAEISFCQPKLLIFVMDPGIVVVIIIIIWFFLQLYTVSTLVLVFQCVYYDYIRRWSKYRQINSKHEVQFNFLAPKSIQKAFSYNQPFLTGLFKVMAHIKLFIFLKIISKIEKSY